MINFYRTYIAEGKTIAFFALVVSILFQCWLLVNSSSETSAIGEPNGFLWNLLFHQAKIDNQTILLLVNLMIVILLSLLLSYSSWHHSLIRDKTFLPFALSVLIFSCNPQSLTFAPSNITALLFFVAFCMILGLYQDRNPQWTLFSISLILGISSLISIGVLPFCILLFGGLLFLRIFNLKNILAILFGFLFIYWINLITAFFLGKLPEFFDSFSQLGNITFLHIVEFSTKEWILSGIYLFLFVVFLIDYQMNLHKDKIRIRALIDFFFFLSFFLFLSYSLLCWDLRLTSFLTIGSFIIPLSHYFALTSSKIKIIFFYLLMAVYLVVCFGQFFIA